MIKKALVLSISILLIGCRTQPQTEEMPKNIEIPFHHIILKNEKGAFNGIGIGFENNTFLSLRPNEEKNSSIFWGEQKIIPKQKYLDENILFFELFEKDVPLFKDIEDNLIIGSNVYWFSNSDIQKGIIKGVSENEIFIEGNITSKSQGAPIFNEDKRLIGILSSADPKNKKIVGTKIKPILSFWENNK